MLELVQRSYPGSTSFADCFDLAASEAYVGFVPHVSFIKLHKEVRLCHSIRRQTTHIQSNNDTLAMRASCERVETQRGTANAVKVDGGNGAESVS